MGIYCECAWGNSFSNILHAMLFRFIQFYFLCRYPFGRKGTQSKIPGVSMRERKSQIIDIYEFDNNTTIHLRTGKKGVNSHPTAKILEVSANMAPEATMTICATPTPHLSHLPLLEESRYTIQTELGRGGMGVVHSVYDHLLQRKVAMKVIFERVMKDKRLRDGFVREAQTMASLHHPSIISIHDVGKTKEGNIFFMMDAVEGKTMKHRIRELHDASEEMRWSQKQWGLRRIIDAFYRVCQTIAYVHDSNIAHLDIKPMNIQLGQCGEVWVLDWGLARDAGGFEEEVWCSPHYTSPERSTGYETLSCDVYSLGCVLYEILVGFPPFFEDDPKSIFEKLEQGEIPKISEQKYHQRLIPKELIALCERCMLFTPEDRPSIEQLTNELREWLDGSQKKERAQQLVQQALTYQREAVKLETQNQDILRKVTLLRKNLPKNHTLESKYPLWDLEHQAQQVLDKANRLREEFLLLLKQALFLSTSTYEASTLLIEDCIEQHQLMLRLKSYARAHVLKMEAHRYLELLPKQHPVHERASKYFVDRMNCTLRLPKSCSVIIESFADSRKRLQAKVLDIVDCEGVFSKELPLGSYRLRILKEGHQEVQYPFFLEPGQEWSTTYDLGEQEEPLPLPTDNEILTNACYVPQSWFYASGDTAAPNSLREERVWIDGFIISRTPVTHGEYLDFINDTMREKGYEHAAFWLPREQASQDRDMGAPIYIFENDQFHHPKGTHFHNHPVVQISWHSAVAYTQWLSEKTGESWRLPSELEWEKAARGVDRRYFPWGDEFEPSFCNMMDSLPEKPEIKSVTHQPLDVSVYGVLSCAGNTREWCLDRFSADRLPIENRKLRYPTMEELSSTGFRSSRGGSFGNAAARTRSADRDWWFPQLSYIGRGFRVLRSWPPTEESNELQHRISQAHSAHYQDLLNE